MIAQPNNATGCTRVFPAIPVDRNHAQKFLPEGFVAAESSTFFGQQSFPANSGLLIVSVMRCEKSEWGPAGYVEGMIGIFVEPPIVEGQRVGGEHFYELARVVSEDQPYASVLKSVEWAVVDGALQITSSATPLRSGSTTLSDADGLLFSASVPSAPAKDDFTGTLHLRWWQKTTAGTGFFEYEFAPDGYLGPGSCEARSGSIAAAVLQSTTCREALFMVGPPYDLVSRFEYRADVG